METLLQLKDASFGYGNAAVTKATVSNISFNINEGDFVHLTGANGSGKSTIIRGILGLVSCFSGEITFHIKKSKIGYIPQEGHIERSIPASVMDIVGTAQANHWGKNKKQLEESLALVGMKKFGQKRFGELSGGQRRRVLLARALMGNPELLILDEPTANTDKETNEKIGAVLTTLYTEKKIGIIVTSHEGTWTDKARVLQVTPEGLK